jgi:hypothetical protein
MSAAARRALVLAILAWGLAAPALAAGERYALVVTGASGGDPYDEQYQRWASGLEQALVGSLGFPRDHVTVLTESAAAPSRQATAANVRQALTSMARIGSEDVLFVMLIGHGTFDGRDAKFNLVGPDLEAAEWAHLLAPVRGRVVVVNGASASFPFLARLAGPRRVVITATDSEAQRFDTVFPEFFIRALTDGSADLDKNGRTSIWEAFVGATGNVRRYYQQQGTLPTESGLLDDTGDGIGHEAGGGGDEGLEASGWYLDVPPAGAAPTDRDLVRLLQQKAALEAELSDLRVRRAFLSTAEYQAEFERIMVSLARVSRDIRSRGGS